MLIEKVRSQDVTFWRVIFPTRFSMFLAAICCVVIPISLDSLHISKNSGISPVDEAAHFGYVTVLSKGSLPRQGEYLSPYVLRVIACSGVELEGFHTPPCNSLYLDPKGGFPGGGYLTEAIQPPIYYAVTAPIRWFNIHIVGTTDLTGTRLGGELWLVMALLIFWAASRLLGIRILATAAAVLIIASSPLSIYYTSIVTNDSPSLLAGSFFCLLGVLAFRYPGRWVGYLFLFSSLVASWIKATDVFPALVVAILLGIMSSRNDLQGRKQLRSWTLVGWDWMKGPGWAFVGSIIGLSTWQFISSSRSIVNNATVCVMNGPPQPRNFSVIILNATASLAPLTGGYTPSKLAESQNLINYEAAHATLLAFFLVGGGLAGLFVAKKCWSHILGLLTLVALLFQLFVLNLIAFLGCGTDVGPNARYGLCLAPLLVLAVLGNLKTKLGLFLLWVFAIVGVLLETLRLLIP